MNAWLKRSVYALAGLALIVSSPGASQDDGFDFFEEFDANLQCARLLRWEEYTAEAIEQHIMWAGNFIVGYIFSEFDDESVSQLELFRFFEDERLRDRLLIWTRCNEDPDLSMLDIARTVSDELRDQFAGAD